MITTFITALILPLRRWRDVVKVFSAYAGAGLLGRVVLLGRKPSEDSLDAVIVVVGLIFMFLIGARAAVHWHRVVVLDEPAQFVPPMPNMAAIRYAVWSIWILFILFAFFGAIVWLVAQWDYGLANQLVEAMRSATGDTAGQSIGQWLFGTLVFLLACLAIALVAGEVLLALPRVSVADRLAPAALQTFGVRTVQFPIAVVAMFGLSAIADFVLSLIAVHGGSVVAHFVLVMRFLAGLWLTVALVTLLSLVYMQFVPDDDAAQT